MGGMLDRERADFVDLAESEAPRVLVVIDTEEEFDWGAPLSRDNTSVTSIAAQVRAQEVFAKHGIVPTYVIDYPVASDAQAVRDLGGFLARERCEIGAHLHPWVNPPHDEAVTARNSYPGNLPPELEREKLYRLTAKIEESFGRRPRVYKAGRYGVGPNTAGILEDLGYAVCASVVPYTSFTEDGGPDFRRFEHRPYWFGERRRLLEIPLSVGFAGHLAAWGPSVFPYVSGELGLQFRVPGILARLDLMERIRLTPEGADHEAHRRLLDSLYDQGCRVFSLTYHSPSLEPGHTPYVRTEEHLQAFLEVIDRTLGYLLKDLGGRPTTASGLPDELVKAPAAPRLAAAG